MNIEEIEKLAKGINSLCCEAKRNAKDKLYRYFVENYKEIDTGCFSLSNYIIECDGDLYFLKKWAEAKTRYWGNREVATALYNEKDYAYTTAHRIKLLDYHFELDEDGVAK